MNIRFGKELEAYVKAQVEHGSFEDPGEFVRHCVREHREGELAAAIPNLRALLSEGLRSQSLPANPKSLASEIQRRHRYRHRQVA